MDSFESPRHEKQSHPRRGRTVFGGPEEIRTPDPYNANVMRSQLRYGPMGYLDIIALGGGIVKKKMRKRGKIQGPEGAGHMANWQTQKAA